MVDKVVAYYTIQGVVHNHAYTTPAVKRVTRLFGPDREFSVHLRYMQVILLAQMEGEIAGQLFPEEAPAPQYE
jgi:hypothetical protein